MRRRLGLERSRRRVVVGAMLAAAGVLWGGYCAAFGFDWFGLRWSAAERTTLASMQVCRAPMRADMPGVPAARRAEAAVLGKRIFADTRFSGNGAVSCATCHDPGKQFQDDRELGHGISTGLRRTMTLAGTANSPFLMWDGRKDSLWAQALGPLEDAREHGGTRLGYARVLEQHYRAEYERVFGAMPDLAGMPPSAGPLGNPAERAAWSALPAAARHDVSQVFANMGKLVATYENTLHFGPSRFDQFVAGTLKDEPAARRLLDQGEINGLRVFIGKGQCVTCHSGPLLTDGHFHNTGVPQRDPATPDVGRKAAMAQVLNDEFNCVGAFSGVAPDKCDELRFLAVDDPHMLGAFKTPSLRNVAGRAPYMHAGQLRSVTDVIRHYATAPAAAVGTSEIKPAKLSAVEMRDLAAFLATLTGPILEGPVTR